MSISAPDRTVKLLWSGHPVTFTGDGEVFIQRGGERIDVPRAFPGEAFLAWRDRRGSAAPVILPLSGLTVTFDLEGSATVHGGAGGPFMLSGRLLGDLLDADLHDARARAAATIRTGTRVAYLDWRLDPTLGTVAALHDGSADVVFDNGIEHRMMFNGLILADHPLATRTSPSD